MGKAIPKGQNMFEKILALIEKYDRIIIHRHKNPDGDALGSQLGLLHMIKDTYPHKEVYAVGDMTPRYAFMLTQPMDEIADELAFDSFICGFKLALQFSAALRLYEETPLDRSKTFDASVVSSMFGENQGTET